MTDQPMEGLEPERPHGAGEDPGGEPESSLPSGYRNLWVPLIVVPFLVVGVIALVFVFFGAISGRDATMEENLRKMVEGGANERGQASLSLVAQVLANEESARAGNDPEWDAGPDFLERLQEAWADMDAGEDHDLRLALARVLAHYGDPEVRGKLVQLLEIADESDPDGRVRFGALLALGELGDPAAAGAVIPFLENSDPYLQLGAASALQALPGEASVEALRAVLGDGDLALRGMAAISLTHLGDDAGHAVLLDLVDLATYEAIRAEDSTKYADPNLVQNNRIRALQALARLGRPGDLALFRELADDEGDPAVREAAMRARDALAARSAGE